MINVLRFMFYVVRFTFYVVRLVTAVELFAHFTYHILRQLVAAQTAFPSSLLHLAAGVAIE